MSVEYMEWAKAQLEGSPSVYDWQNMPLAEMSERALAICEAAKDGTTEAPINAFYCLEKMALAMKERYPRRYP
jgi:hypothetical protein